MRDLLKKTLKIGKKEFIYVAIMAMAAIFGYARMLIFGKYLTPEAMGYLSIVLTIASYGAFLQLGLMSGLNRELPVRLGRKKEKFSSILVAETSVSVLILQLAGIAVYYIILANIKFNNP